MKKYLAVFVVLVMAGFSSIALAADVTVGGLVSIRSRNFEDLQLDKAKNAATIDTQSKIMIDVNAKADGVKGKISLWNDFSSWGTLDENAKSDSVVRSAGTFTAGHPAVSAFGFREAWVSFNVPNVPVNVTAGHQLLATGNEWFFRQKHFGSDAWVVANVTGNNTAAFVDVKVAEGLASRSDDVDAYVLLDVFKIDDNNMVGANVTDVRLGTKDNALQNLTLHYSGKLAMVNLKAQGDYQMGKNKTGATETKYKGNEIVVQGNVAMDPVTINFMAGRGSGPKIGDTDTNAFVNFLDIDPHYTFLYEYKLAGACGDVHQGLCNTTVLSVGAAFAATKGLTLGANAYFLQATEKMASKKIGAAAGATSSDLGTEVDLQVNWKLYDNLTWNWNLGWLKPGDALGNDDATGIQGILTFAF